MKKIIVIAFALMVSLTSVQAQKKSSATKIKSGATTEHTEAQPASTASKIIKLSEPVVGIDKPLIEVMKSRRTERNFSEDKLDNELISSLLWCTYGFNRPEEGRRVVPSAVNVQEFDIYLFDREGAYKYNAKSNTLHLVVAGDHRAKISAQPHFAVAPVSIVIVANYERMKQFKAEADRDFYASVDCGYVSQNIYLFCASADLGTVACGGINRDEIAKILNIKDGKVMLAHPVGFVK